MAELNDKPIVRRILDWEDRLRKYWDQYHMAMDEEDAFLEGDRYEDNEDWHNRDRRLIQIKGRETEDAIRHLCAVWFTKPRNLQARPVDNMGDAAMGEFMTSLIELEWNDPYKGFDDELYKAVMASLEHRCGVVWMDWYPDLGPWGEMVYSEFDARGMLWDPQFHPHHPKNGGLLLKRRFPVDEAREMYNAPWLEPDRITRAYPQRHGNLSRPIMKWGGRLMTDYDDDSVEVWQFWNKNDRTQSQRASKKDQRLPEGQRYMACMSGCGYRSPRQSDTGQELPDTIEQGCPTCRGNLERIDALSEMETILAYPKGRRLTIIAPNQIREDDSLYDGKWPVPTARSYPGLWIFNQLKNGGKAMGLSITAWQWDQQVASDQIATHVIQQVFSHSNLYIMPKAGLYDRNGRRFERRDDQGNTAFRDDSNQFMRPNPIQVIPGMGVDPSVNVAINLVQNKLTQYRGVLDFGLTPESSKNIAASTVAQLTQQENLPAADFIKRLRRGMSMFAGVNSDYIIATYPTARVARLNLDNAQQFVSQWGPEVGRFDFEIEDTPEFTGLEKERSDALQQLDNIFFKYSQMGLPAEVAMQMVTLYAEEMHFPPSTVTKYEKAMQAIIGFQQQQQQQQQMQQQQMQQMHEQEAAKDMQAGIPVPGMEIPAPQ